MSKDMFAPGAKEAIFLSFKHELYGVPKASLRRDKDRILLKNMDKLHVLAIENTQTYHNGIWHVVSFNDPRGTIIRLELAKEFHKEMDEISAEWEQLESEELDMIAYLKRILNASMTFADLQNLTPHCLHFTLPRFIGGSISHEKTTMSRIDITRWRTMNKDTEQFVKQRMLTNLLLPRES